MGSPEDKDLATDTNQNKDVGWTDPKALDQFLEGVAEGFEKTIKDPIRWLIGGVDLGGGDNSK